MSNNNERRPLTAYNRFVRSQASLRPPTTTPTEWMREVGRRWHNRNQQPLIANDDDDDDDDDHRKECIICYENRSLHLYHDGPCDHHKDICDSCVERVLECPICRMVWREPPPPPRQPRQRRRQYQNLNRMFFNNILLHIEAILGHMDELGRGL